MGCASLSETLSGVLSPRQLSLIYLSLALGMAPGQADEIVLHSFNPIPLSGASPRAGLILDSAGNLYGTAPSGGAANAGVVYKLDTTGKQTVLYNFTGGDDGAQP